MKEPTYKHHPDCPGSHPSGGFGCPMSKELDWEKDFLARKDQPCDDFEENETSLMTNEAVPHECPECGGTRYSCANCKRDHHKDGWKLCLVKRILTAKEDALRKSVDDLRRMESDYDDEDKRARRDVRPYNEALDEVLALLTPKN
jgi:predicted RNA-binding Zn-ribbon protein involved in translation (DUF1610 family)